MPGETKQQRRAKWDNIASTLNAVGGIQKDGTGWQLLWRNWRYRVRKNVRGNVSSIRGTGGGAGVGSNPVTEPGEVGTRVVDLAANLPGLDSRVMSLVGWDTVSGIPGSLDVSFRGAVTEREGAHVSTARFYGHCCLLRNQATSVCCLQEQPAEHETTAPVSVDVPAAAGMVCRLCFVFRHSRAKSKCYVLQNAEHPIDGSPPQDSPAPIQVCQGYTNG